MHDKINISKSLCACFTRKENIFDDSILQDRQTNINEGILLSTNGLMSKKRFMVEILGYTEEEALQELKDINDESGMTLDRFELSDQMAQEGNIANPEKEPQAKEEEENAAEDES